MAARAGLFLDGGFLKKKLQQRNGHFPSAAEVVAYTGSLFSNSRLKSCELFRAYFYDAPPYARKAQNPLDGSEQNFAETAHARENQKLLDSLELQPDFAVRRGQLTMRGWKLKPGVLAGMRAHPRELVADDLLPDIAQKGVDLRIGIDVAWVSIKRIVEVIVLVTGDSDLVPAMKFARKEGAKVYLDTMGHPVRRELLAHADFVISSSSPPRVRRRRRPRN